METFKSSYLGYYLLEPHGGHGLMHVGLSKVVSGCFSDVGLNRLEANIQPENVRSSRLVKRLGFRLEGLSERYLKIGGRWKDHERWAVHKNEWQNRGAA